MNVFPIELFSYKKLNLEWLVDRAMGLWILGQLCLALLSAMSARHTFLQVCVDLCRCGSGGRHTLPT